MFNDNNHAVAAFGQNVDEIGDLHVATSIDTPMTELANLTNDDEKIEVIARHFKAIMEAMGLDLTDDSLRGTPLRVAKMYVKEVFKGLYEHNKPKVSLFENIYNYNKILIEKNITVKSTCEHHFLPIIGRAHVGYISSGKVIGLSKINRIVDYYAKRPQVQERMTRQIIEELKSALDTEDVIVVVEAVHHCVSLRGIEDDNSSTVTMEYSAKFINATRRNEFLEYIKNDFSV